MMNMARKKKDVLKIRNLFHVRPLSIAVFVMDLTMVIITKIPKERRGEELQGRERGGAGTRERRCG
jgi:hypothetical protein